MGDTYCKAEASFIEKFTFDDLIHGFTPNEIPKNVFVQILTRDFRLDSIEEIHTIDSEISLKDLKKFLDAYNISMKCD